MDAENLFEVKDLCFSHGEVVTLRNVSFGVPKGSVVGLMGRNGVGKTTLLRCLMGLLKPSAGEILLDGKAIVRTPPHRRSRLGMGYVPQGRQIFAQLTVEENLVIALPRGVKRVPQEIYDFFPVLFDMRKRAGGNLSGGQQQQLAIGRALAGGPRMLLLDEPTEGIQPNIIQQIGGILQRLAREKGMTILVVEQYLDFVREHTSSFLIMNRGAVTASGPIQNLTQELVHQYLSV